MDCGLDLVGYSFVPITPFLLKDWEKHDFYCPPETYSAQYAKQKQRYRLDGYVSSESGWTPKQLTPEMEQRDSIQHDLELDLFLRNPQKTIYVMHCPPWGTSLDMISSGQHVGSLATLHYIKKHRPFLTLHGHIHECVAQTGIYKETIEETVCLAPGNDHLGSITHVIEFDPFMPMQAHRVVL